MNTEHKEASCCMERLYVVTVSQNRRHRGAAAAPAPVVMQRDAGSTTCEPLEQNFKTELV